MIKEYILLLALSVNFFIATAQEKIKIACLGNSITYGLDIANREKMHTPLNYRTCWVMVTR
jgi:hypothetical protein